MVLVLPLLLLLELQLQLRELLLLLLKLQLDERLLLLLLQQQKLLLLLLLLLFRRLLRRALPALLCPPLLCGGFPILPFPRVSPAILPTAPAASRRPRALSPRRRQRPPRRRLRRRQLLQQHHHRAPGLKRPPLVRRGVASREDAVLLSEGFCGGDGLRPVGTELLLSVGKVAGVAKLAVALLQEKREEGKRDHRGCRRQAGELERRSSQDETRVCV